MIFENTQSLKAFLDEYVDKFNRPDFIPNDPVSIPHRFSLPQDIEIMGLLAATLAWGQRITIIKKCEQLIAYMGGQPYEFILHHSEPELRQFERFVHRTFNSTDLLYFIRFFRHWYEQNDTLETLFAYGIEQENGITNGLVHFHNTFFSLPDAPMRTRKHVATPVRKSACKRLNMFLRWMVRKDNKGVDFGIWHSIQPAALICPCDVHVERVARKLGLIKRKQSDWQTALELTHNLSIFDASDPVKYDFALFGLGLEGF